LEPRTVDKKRPDPKIADVSSLLAQDGYTPIIEGLSTWARAEIVPSPWTSSTATHARLGWVPSTPGEAAFTPPTIENSRMVDRSENE
jgi:hypothetical protein